MNSIFKKLNFKDHQEIRILQSPASFKPAMEEMKALTNVKTSLADAKEIEFIISFVTKQDEVNSITKQIAPLIKDDGIIWFAYPKGTSKKYKCEFNRDTGWAELGKHGFEGVRMVAIDEDWSALRFRNAKHIKTMTRSFAMSDEGRKKVSRTKKPKSSK